MGKVKILLYIATLHILFSCRTTSEAQKVFELAEPTSENFITDINTSLHYTDEDFANNKFIFLRLHHINYKDNFRIDYAWRSLVSTLGKASDGNYYTHSSMNYSLTDNFIGLTSRGKNAVKYECFKNTDANPYLSRIDLEKSSCAVLAIPCTPVEWENCKELMEWSVSENVRFSYSVGDVFVMPGRHKRNLRRIKKLEGEFEGESKPLEKDCAEYFKDRKRYVCSGYIAKILSVGLARVQWEVENAKTNPAAYLPIDFFIIDGVEKLFTCRLSYYNEAVEEYIKIYPQFAEYFSPLPQSPRTKS